MNKKKVKLVIAALVVVGGIGGLVFASMQDTVTYYMKPTEILAKVKNDASSVYGERVRVGGVVIQKTTTGSASSRSWEFTITDDKGTGDLELVSLSETLPETRILVKYKGIMPDTFQDGVIAIVDGSLDKNNVFVADTVLAKCPSKYEAADAEDEGMAKKGKADAEDGRGLTEQEIIEQ